MTIDPVYTSIIGTTGGGDTHVNSLTPTTSYAAATDLRVGKATDGSVNRALVRFDFAGVPAGALEVDAQLKLYNFDASSCTGAPVDVHTLAGAFGPTTT